MDEEKFFLNGFKRGKSRVKKDDKSWLKNNVFIYDEKLKKKRKDLKMKREEEEKEEKTEAVE